LVVTLNLMRISRLLTAQAILLLGLASWGATADGSTSSVPICSSSVLTLHPGFTEASAGNVGTPIVITNHGPSSCSLSGFPVVVGHTEASSPQPVAFVHRPRSQIYRAVLPRTVVLPPEGTASFGLSYVGALDQQDGNGERCQMNALTVRFPDVSPARRFNVPLVTNGHDGYGPINSCFAGFILGLTPVVKGPTPPEY
jgi:hypothetical protein